MEISNQPGISLRAARDRAGWSVTEVAHRTKFPRSIIEALEKDDYTIFSSPTYAKSYLSQYAEFLGVDPSPWLDFFGPASFTAPQDVLCMIKSPLERESSHASAGKGSRGSNNMVPPILCLFLTVGLIYAAFTGYAHLEKRLGESMANKPPSPPAASTPESGIEIPAAPSQPAQARQEAPADAATPATAQPAAKAVEPATAPRPTIVVEE